VTGKVLTCDTLEYYRGSGRPRSN